LRSPHLLRAASNVRRVKENLVSVVNDAAILAIEREIRRNVRQLIALATSHYNFAVGQPDRYWRQKVSRLYYAAYNTSRAVRLFVNGEYTTDVTDHKKIEAIPDDFPNRNTYANKLVALREDRNLCDYDHTVSRPDLVLKLQDSIDLVDGFMADARKYLRKRGRKL
jgi:hypothetical protein